MIAFLIQLDDTTQAIVVYVVLALAAIAIIGLVFRLARHGFRIKAGPVEIDCEDDHVASATLQTSAKIPEVKP